VTPCRSILKLQLWRCRHYNNNNYYYNNYYYYYYGFLFGTTWRNIHPLSPIKVISHLLSASSIYYSPWHHILLVQFMCMTVFLHNLSKFYLVWLLAWHPSLHTPYIFSPNRCLFFAAYAHTIATCFAIVLRSSSNPSLSLNPLLGTLSCSLMPHIHLTILISARWSACELSGQRWEWSDGCVALRKSQNLANSKHLLEGTSLHPVVWLTGGCCYASSVNSSNLTHCACGRRAGRGIRPTTSICLSVPRS